MAGSTWIHTYVQALAGLGYPSEFAPCVEKFKFGTQGTLMSSKCWYLPVMLYGRMGTLAVHEVPGDCPLLISEESMTRLGVVLRLRDKKIDIEDLQVTGCKLDFHPKSGARSRGFYLRSRTERPVQHRRRNPSEKQLLTSRTKATRSLMRCST